MSVVYINEYVPPVGMFLNRPFTTNCNPNRIPPLPIINSPTRNIKETFESGSSTEQIVENTVANEVNNSVANEVNNNGANVIEKPVSNEVDNTVDNVIEKPVSNEVGNRVSNEVDNTVANETQNVITEKTEPFVNNNVITNNVIREPVNTNHGNFYPMGGDYSRHFDRDLKDLVRAIENERFYRYFDSVNREAPVTKSIYIPKTSHTKSENNSTNIILICSAIIIAALLLRK